MDDAFVYTREEALALARSFVIQYDVLREVYAEIAGGDRERWLDLWQNGFYRNIANRSHVLAAFGIELPAHIAAAPPFQARPAAPVV